ncbi:CehA/McbA family metallohydrolase [Pseudoduganella lurida]|uniref:CehA/McbA family metallohydrolase n=1 Tax=Pseudoduganella lurida TaxID=1036180 RepID=UPI001E3BC477|nr:CehA/McbA family metallohydrolase [Pseudoduganella lurida]
MRGPALVVSRAKPDDCRSAWPAQPSAACGDARCQRCRHPWLAGLAACVLGIGYGVPAGARQPASAVELRDHDEFEAWLEAPWRAAAAASARRFVMRFRDPRAAPGARVGWQLELRDAAGRVVRRWRGTTLLANGVGEGAVRWQAPAAVPPGGAWRVRMRAVPPAGHGGAVEQERRVAGGTMADPRRLGAFRASATFALDMLPWDIYLGNLHSQTGHSDGGGALDTCDHAQPPQSAAAGPAAAFAYAREHGLDFLLASEHNHMYDGSADTARQADPARAQALFRAGLAEAADFTAAHPGFVALYGLEWGVAEHGHLNILNGTELLGWERNAAGELLADTATPRTDYAGLYTLLRERGWLGQFNHPNASQFRAAGKPLGYTADGDAAMVLCEVSNSNAFSARTDEGEPRFTHYETTCQRALEAGYHVAFSSNQDNHCANWGASAPNRTGVLLPAGTPLTAASLLEAIAARRVFATMDKAASLVLTANGHMMGERFVNQGDLALSVRYRHAAGTAPGELVLVSGVPGRNGKPAQVTLAATEVTLRPEPGEHYYYARLTQEDGKVLWSAPLWVAQEAGAAEPPSDPDQP